MSPVLVILRVNACHGEAVSSGDEKHLNSYEKLSQEVKYSNFQSSCSYFDDEIINDHDMYIQGVFFLIELKSRDIVFSFSRSPFLLPSPSPKFKGERRDPSSLV